MRCFVRIVCGVLALCVVLAIPLGVSAVENPRASRYFMAYRVYIYKLGGNNYEAYYDVTGTGGMLEIGAKSLAIQRSPDGVNWTTVTTYASDYYTMMIAENTGTYEWSFYRTAISGNYYRLEVVLWAKDNSGSGEMTVWSDPVWFG